MIALLIMAAVGVLPLDELPPQRLAQQSCALFLWDRDSERRIAMVTGNPPVLTIVRGNKTETLAGEAGSGTPVLGFLPQARFRGGGIAIATDLTIAATGVGGAIIREGTLTLTQADGTAIVAPVAGLIGCQ